MTTDVSAMLTQISEKAEAWTKRLPEIDRLKDEMKFLQLRLAESGYSLSLSEKSLTQQILNSPAFKAVSENGMKTTGQMKVKSLFPESKALTHDAGSGAALISSVQVPGIIASQQRLGVRDLIPVGPTTSDLIEFSRELTYTNNAAPVFSAGKKQNVQKPQSDMTFERVQQPVETIAHFIEVSKQILRDVRMLQSYLDSRLMYGLKLKEEQQLLFGTGNNGELAGIVPLATPYDTTLNSAGATSVDILGQSLYQVEEESDYEASAIVLNPFDWAKIAMLKNSNGDFIMFDPRGFRVPTLWGKPVVTTKTMPKGKFLVGAFNVGAQIWDREEATVEVSCEHADLFTKNMAAVLCEERIALTVYRPKAFVYGDLA